MLVRRSNGRHTPTSQMVFSGQSASREHAWSTAADDGAGDGAAAGAVAGPEPGAGAVAGAACAIGRNGSRLRGAAGADLPKRSSGAAKARGTPRQTASRAAASASRARGIGDGL